MKKICITFSGGAYDPTTKKIVENAPRFGADEVIVYDDVWLLQQTAFCEQNRWAFEHHHKRGFGWYIWKPFVIYHALHHANDGDIILFVDADTYPVADLDPLYDICRDNGGVMLFSAANWNNRQFCKRDCFLVMNQDEPQYHDAQAAVARFMLFQKGSWRAEQFLAEWLTYTTNKLCNTFDPSTLGPELEGFQEHRCEQAVLTNLAHKYGCRLYREACQAGEGFEYDWDLFPTTFFQDGTVAERYKNTTIPVTGSSYRNLHKPPKNMVNLLEILRHFVPKEHIRTIVEAGAKDCADTLALHDTFTQAQLYPFECNPETLPLCKEAVRGMERIHLTESAVSDEQGTITFYPIDTQNTVTVWKDGNPGASSLFKASGLYPAEQYAQKEVTVPAMRLDTFLEQHDMPSIDLLWLDAQGAEIKIMQGLGMRLHDVRFIHTEVNFMEIYEGQPLFADLRRFLEERDFSFIGFTSRERYFGDAVFVNTRLVSKPITERLIRARLEANSFLQKVIVKLRMKARAVRSLLMRN